MLRVLGREMSEPVKEGGLLDEDAVSTVRRASLSVTADCGAACKKLWPASGDICAGEGEISVDISECSSESDGVP